MYELNFNYIPLSLLHQWIVVDKLSDYEMGLKMRTYYWDVVSEIKQNK